MTSTFITAIGNGVSSAIGWLGDVVDALGTSGDLADVLGILGLCAGLGVFAWGLNKLIGLFRNIG